MGTRPGASVSAGHAVILHIRTRRAGVMTVPSTGTVGITDGLCALQRRVVPQPHQMSAISDEVSYTPSAALQLPPRLGVQCILTGATIQLHGMPDTIATAADGGIRR